jgi:DNA-binding transcriptional LysR family regulator
VVAVCSAKSPHCQEKNTDHSGSAELSNCIERTGSGTLAALKYNLEKNGIKLSGLNVKVRLAGTEALKNFLREDTCLGFLPKGSILKELRDGDLVALKIEKFQIIRDFFFIQRHGTDNNDLNKAFIRFCKNEV